MIYFAHIPGGNDQPTGIGIGSDLLNYLGYLIVNLAVYALPAAPLMTINGAQFAVFIGPVVPDFDVVFLQIFDVGTALKKPKKFVDYGLGVEFFGG